MFVVENAGYKSKAGFIVSVLLVWCCVMYLVFLLVVVLKSLWPEMQLIKTIRSYSLSGPTSTGESGDLRPSSSTIDKSDINKMLKWFLTLYIISAIVFGITTLTEQIVYATAQASPCPGSYYSVLILSYARPTLYAFFAVRIDTVFKNSVFELSKWLRFIIVYFPVPTYVTLMTARVAYGRSHSCNFVDNVLSGIKISYTLTDIMCLLILFFVFIYKLFQVLIAKRVLFFLTVIPFYIFIIYVFLKKNNS
ncbi:hypothetical protein RFI_00792 [Reticulomyxa filosa]|uniref:Uncharacterized protein n=1 Tax=Reticulomyxa filosa TaxID=46433 RepID=X6PCL0_RETFI|nr:hypothetical protein RFI_00792 [Reticulomyxa filosa]|eukprot:ETO36270.1 hypothetical protein RFI_00792 [Reticulomyxa filosa]